MFKIVKSATYSALQKEVRDLQNDLRIVKEREQNFRAQSTERGEKISSLQAQYDACRAMRKDLQDKLSSKENALKSLELDIDSLTAVKRDLNKQVESLKTDLAKQGNELVTKTDEVKQMKRSLDVCQKKQSELEAQNKAFGEQTSREDDLIKAINAAITEMRKTRKGRTSLNNVAALKILTQAAGQK